MEANEIVKGTEIVNVVNLDIRTATRESIARIRQIKNVVNLLYSPETASLLGALNVVNVVNPIEASAGAKVHHDRVVLNHATLHGQAEPLNMVVFGQVIVDADVTEEDIQQGLAELSVAGQLLCPEHVAKAIEHKLRNLRGPMHVYPRSAKPIVGSLDLNERFLRSLDDGTELMVIGKLSAKQIVPNELLERKVKRIHVADGVVCREENAEVLLARLERKSGADRVTVIPAGYHLVERALVLNARLLGALPSRKLYCTELLRIDEDVDADGLDRGVEAIVAKEMVICPAALAGVMSKKLDVLDTEALFYDGALWLIDGESALTPATLGYLEGRATLVVLGKASIAPDVAPETLVDRLIEVHNYGFIEGSPDQIAALQFKLGTNEGELTEKLPAEPEEAGEGEKAAERGPRIVNVVNLKL